MLVLSRKLNEQIVIGDAVLTVVAIRGNTIRLGIDAPQSVPVKRLPPAPRPDPAGRGAANGD